MMIFRFQWKVCVASIKRYSNSLKFNISLNISPNSCIKRFNGTHNHLHFSVHSLGGFASMWKAELVTIRSERKEPEKCRINVKIWPFQINLWSTVMDRRKKIRFMIMWFGTQWRIFCHIKICQSQFKILSSRSLRFFNIRKNFIGYFQFL